MIEIGKFKAEKLNCWDYLKCNYGPNSYRPCPAAIDETSNGVNGGLNAGRICWSVKNTRCFNMKMGSFIEKKKICFTCGFFHQVKKEEGDNFQMFKLAQGVKNPNTLHSMLSLIEDMMKIHDRLNTQFDLYTTIRDITSEARKVTGAQRSIVFLVKGNPPALQGDFKLRGKDVHVKIEINDNSIVGFAANHKQTVNYTRGGSKAGNNVDRLFNRSFDEQCNCKTNSLLAVPVLDSENRILGVITAANARKGYFSADDEWFMHMYATEVALAVEKQKLLQQSFSVLRLATIGESIASLSHCIKNIAQALRGSSYIIKKAIESGDIRNIKTAWEILDRHIESLANLSLDVLRYQPATGIGGEKTKLNEIVIHVRELFAEEARARAARIEALPGEDVDPCNIDGKAIYRCLINLVSNALDACPLSEGIVIIKTRRTGRDEVMVEVSDNGRGMDEETKERVFELFETTKPEKGTGLGLPTVVDIVKNHNGRIEIDSSPGKGTAFRIYLKEV